MTFFHNKFLLTLLSGLPLLTAALPADTINNDAENAPSEQEHVSVGSRPFNEEAREEMNRRRAIEREQEEAQGEPSDLYRYADLTRNTSRPQLSIAPSLVERPKFLLTSYPTSCHWLTSIDDMNKSLEMEDGAHWELTPADRHIISYWRRGDSLVITPNYNWFSSGDYFITNKCHGTYVRADLRIGPMRFGQYSHWIVAIDHISGHVTLENGVTWCISAKDNSVFREWAVNDHIILGMYDSWFHAFDHILINVHMDTHVRAKQY